MLTKTRAAALVAALLSVGAIVVATTRSPADAHGTLMFPASRTYACYKNGLAGGGDLRPSNAACQAAIAAGGTQPLYDWFGNLISDAAGRTVGYIPDGKLCGPTKKYDAYNAARADWPATSVAAGPVTIRFSGWAQHPGNWRLWITKPGFDPTKPLAWSDLDDQPFSTYSSGRDANSSGADGPEYTWRATLPARTGRHIVYSVWSRTDSPETFYDCADVDFGGGGPTPTTAPTTPTTGPVVTPPTTTTRPGTPPTATPTPPAGPKACSAAVRVISSWNGGFQGEVAVTNTGSQPLSGWIAGFTLPPGVTVGSGWGAEYVAMGDLTTAWSTGWTRSVAPGATVTSGFLASGSVGSGVAARGCLA